MRWSNMFIPTLREEPANVEALSHKLLLRAGFLKQLTAGVYSILPLGQRVRLKIIELIRRKMDSIGAQEFMLSCLQPMELWEESGRKDAVADIMFRLKDRKGAELALGLTHEEVFTSIARAGLVSYKQLPQIWYQIQCKFRDEARPRGGLLRVREFTMKDSYSFDLDLEGLDRSFNLHAAAYKDIFAACGLKAIPVEASSGAMGGSDSIEFMLQSDCGEDTLVLCTTCAYAANAEKAESAFACPDPAELGRELLLFATPGIRTIKQLADFELEATADRQIKTLVYSFDEGLVLALVQCDQELNESKLQAVLGSTILRQADELEIHKALGAHPGSLGAVGVKSGTACPIRKIVADKRLLGRKNMFTGANTDDYHLKGVDLERDIRVDSFADLHTVADAETCTKCGGMLKLCKGLELGHIFKLGTRYSESMNARILQADGSRIAILMGSYGIGVERLMAAVAECSNDESGLKWPLAIAPFELILVLVNKQDQEQVKVAERLYDELRRLKVEVLLDDRDERAGVKFNDADLIGVPYRITIGKKISSGCVELLKRDSAERTEIPIDRAAELLAQELRQHLRESVEVL